jgi:hypothetical protein
MIKKITFVSVFLSLFISPLVLSKQIDSMDYLWNYNDSVDGSDIASHAISDSANQLSYDLDAGEWIEIQKDITQFYNGADAISFYFKGSGAANNLTLKLTDSDGDVAVKTMTGVTGITNWKHVIVPTNMMEEWYGSISTERLSQVEFTVTSNVGGSGTLAIDRVQTYKNTLNTSNSALIDNFDFGTTNCLGGSAGPMSGASNDPTVSYDSDNAYQGIYALKIEYDTNAAWCGYYIHLTTSNNTGNKDITGYSYLKFRVKSDVSGNKFNIQMSTAGSSGPNYPVSLTSYLPAGASTSYQEVTIPLTDFTGLSLWDRVRQFNIVFEPSLSPKTGAVYIDNIRLTKTNTDSSGAMFTVEEMETILGWSNLGLNESSGLTTTGVSTVDGYAGKAVQLNYSFNRDSVDTGDWVAIYRYWALNLAGFNALKFEYKGTSASNNVEVKIKDMGDTRFWRKYFNITNTGGSWREMILPINEFDFFDSSDGEEYSIDLRNIKGIYFAVSKNEGGNGTVCIRNLQGISDSIEKIREGKIIKSLTVDNNPFYPNGDGIKDSAAFSFVLSELAEVKLKIYDLAGDKVYESTAGQVSSDTEATLTWDGRDNGGNRLKNGMYIYRVFAEGDDDVDEIKHIIAVFR